MITKSSLCLIILLLISSITDAQTLFRSEKYKFRIKYPDTWEEKKGDGANVVFKVVSDNGSSLNIVVREDKAIRGHKIEEFELKDFVDIIEKNMKSKYNDYELLDYSKTYLDNQIAYSILGTLSYKVMDYKVKMKMVQVATIKGKYMYTITAGSEIDHFDYYEPIMNAIMSTFVFEDY